MVAMESALSTTGAAATIARRVYENVVDATIGLPERCGERIAASESVSRRAVAGRFEGILKANAPPASQRRQAAKEADLVSHRFGVEVAQQDRRKTVGLNERLDAQGYLAHLRFSHVAFAEFPVEVGHKERDSSDRRLDFRAHEDPSLRGPAARKLENMALSDRPPRQHRVANPGLVSGAAVRAETSPG